MKKSCVYLGILLLFLFSFTTKGTAEKAIPKVDQAVKHVVAKDAVSDQPEHSKHQAGHHAPHLNGKNLSLFWSIPFVGILLSIALFPLIAAYFWHHHYGKISLFWGASFLIAFTIGFGLDTSLFYVLEVYLLEFIPFIVLLLALYTVAGGIRLKGELIGSPLVNCCILLIGALLASWMGTTGSAMLLIRPLLRANSWRRYRVHTVIFFIFMVANIGGALTPLGDPPLFLGFLKGVHFFWTTEHMLKPMLFVLTLLMAIFLAIDFILYRKEPEKPERSEKTVKLSLEGKANIILIPAIVGSVLVSSMKLGNAFTLHYVSMPLASLLQVLLLLAITLISLFITRKHIREGNEFSWEPIIEVAKLFATIFITMVPPIAMLKAGSDGPMGVIIRAVIDSNGEFINSAFFWATGMLSSFLDNAPTYLVFFNTAGGHAADLMTTHMNTLLAVSAGAVFMGANTYIGNAPNFMVKSIAEEAGVPMPSFLGYMLLYSLPILIPVFVLVTLIFF